MHLLVCTQLNTVQKEVSCYNNDFRQSSNDFPKFFKAYFLNIYGDCCSED